MAYSIIVIAIVLPDREGDSRNKNFNRGFSGDTLKSSSHENKILQNGGSYEELGKCISGSSSDSQRFDRLFIQTGAECKGGALLQSRRQKLRRARQERQRQKREKRPLLTEAYKIGIVTPTVTVSEDEFRGAEEMVEKYAGFSSRKTIARIFADKEGCIFRYHQPC